MSLRMREHVPVDPSSQQNRTALIRSLRAGFRRVNRIAADATSRKGQSIERKRVDGMALQILGKVLDCSKATSRQSRKRRTKARLVQVELQVNL